jgi:hypothetical protein
MSQKDFIMKQIFLILLLYSTGVMSQSTTINTGINTKTPGSRLTVKGSFAGDYKIVTDQNTVLDDSDFYIAYNGNTKGTIRLPTAISGPGNFKGRIYGIKNTSSQAVLTVFPDASNLEKIDAAGDVDYITIPPGYYAELISKGTITGTTWELSMLVPTELSSEMTQLLNVALAVPKNSKPQIFTVSPINPPDVIIPDSQKTFHLPESKTVFLNFTVGIGLLESSASPGSSIPYYRCELFINNTPTQIFQIVQQHSRGIQFSMSGVYSLPAGTHTIEARLSTWNRLGMVYDNLFGVLSLLLSAVHMN